jgi:hypothetical protein
MRLDWKDDVANLINKEWRVEDGHGKGQKSTCPEAVQERLLVVKTKPAGNNLHEVISTHKKLKPKPKEDHGSNTWQGQQTALRLHVDSMQRNCLLLMVNYSIARDHKSRRAG